MKSYHILYEVTIEITTETTDFFYLYNYASFGFSTSTQEIIG